MKFKVIVLLLGIVLLTGCGKEIVLKDNLKFEVNSELKRSDLTIFDEEIKIVDESELIDTSKLGEKDVVIQYLVGDKVQMVAAKINIIDTTPPVIEAEEKIVATKGKAVNLLEKVKVTDNSNEEIKATVEGDYDINKIGDYSLKYVAIDSSNNKTEKAFTLTVKNVSIKTSGFYINKTSKQWMGVRFKTGGKVETAYNFCPGSGCGGYNEYGTYKVNGNKVIVTLTYSIDDIGEKYKFPKAVKLEFTINSENQITYKSSKYNWKSNFS